MIRTVHLQIRGKVQGVFYRATAKEVADQLGLKGWVKNTEGGEVEAVASGSEEAIGQFIAWCRKGPSRAVVTEVTVTERGLERFDTFSVLR